MTAPEPSQGSIFTESSSIRISSGNLIPSASFREAVAFIDHAVAVGEGLYLFTGAAGAGKTSILNYCRDRATDQAAVLFSSLRRIDADNLSALLNEALGVEPSAEQSSGARALRYFLKLGTLHAKGKRFVLALDDVEEVHSSGAELIRVLLEMEAQNTTLITIILSGDHQLNALLDQSYRWGIQKLIQDSHQITRLGIDQASGLIDQIPALQGVPAIGFSRGAKKAIVQMSGGSTGPMIQLGHRAANIGLRNGAKVVSARMVRGAASGNYRSPAGVAIGVTWKTLLALLVLLLVPVALVQNNPNPDDYVSPPLNGFVDTQQASTVASQVINQSHPTPADVEDDILVLAKPDTGILPRPAASVGILLPASVDVGAGADETTVATPAIADHSADFNLAIPPTAGALNLQLPTETPARVAIYRQLLLLFNQQIPPAPTP